MTQLQQWIAYIFDHPIASPEWYWSLDAPEWQGARVDIPALVADTFEHAAELLARFSDEQLDQGFLVPGWQYASGFYARTCGPGAPTGGASSRLAIVCASFRAAYGDPVLCSPLPS